jgi:hypothetical protein
VTVLGIRIQFEHLHLSSYKKKKNYQLEIKGIVSRDFEVCFLVLLDCSDIATPAGTGSFFKIKSISCRIFDFSGLALVVFAVSESRLRE